MSAARINPITCRGLKLSHSRLPRRWASLAIPIAHERVNTENLGPLLNIFRTIEFERYESAIRLTNPDPYLAYINSCRDLSFDLIPTDSQWHDALEIVRKS